MRILLIKLGALGDVLRTTPLLTAFKRRNPFLAVGGGKSFFLPLSFRKFFKSLGHARVVFHILPECLGLVFPEPFQLARSHV